ncbi:hypothetical protein [uncultured Hymenobacter sp.]|uniref:hypothetical protein n=1 Tax=uncultured Hymenobacter sp. TaxID=170016 RepID=UPI0035CA1659
MKSSLALLVLLPLLAASPAWGQRLRPVAPGRLPEGPGPVGTTLRLTPPPPVPEKSRRRAGAARPAPDSAAPAQTARLELRLSEAENEVHVQPLAADSSVVVLIGQDAQGGRDDGFYFQHYAADLRRRREVPVAVPPEFRFVRLCAEARVVYALFSSRDQPGRLWAVAYDAVGGQLRTQLFETKLSREVVELRAVEGSLFATVVLTDATHLTALLLNVATGQFRFLASIYEPLPTQLSFEADERTGKAAYVLSQNNGRKARLQLKQLGTNGQLLGAEVVQAESERNLLTAQLSPLADSSARLLAGTYSLRELSYAQGLFATDLRLPATVPAGTAPAALARAPLRFYDFLRFKHFFDFLKPRREQRLRQRAARRQQQALAPLRWRYRLLLHPMQPLPGGGFVLTAEVYYPHYRYNNYGPSMGLASAGTYAGYPGYSYYGGNRSFDGYSTSHAVICGFASDGTLLWDNSYVVKDLRRYELTEAIRQAPLPDGRLVLAYLQDDELHYKIVSQAAPSANDLLVPLQTSSTGTGEKSFDASATDLQPWFGTTFVASGFQHVRPEGGVAEREVFFLNKVTFK